MNSKAKAVKTVETKRETLDLGKPMKHVDFVTDFVLVVEKPDQWGRARMHVTTNWAKFQFLQVRPTPELSLEFVECDMVNVNYIQELRSVKKMLETHGYQSAANAVTEHIATIARSIS